MQPFQGWPGTPGVPPKGRPLVRPTLGSAMESIDIGHAQRKLTTARQRRTSWANQEKAMLLTASLLLWAVSIPMAGGDNGGPFDSPHSVYKAYSESMRE